MNEIQEPSAKKSDGNAPQGTRIQLWASASEGNVKDDNFSWSRQTTQEPDFSRQTTAEPFSRQTTEATDNFAEPEKPRTGNRLSRRRSSSPSAQMMMDLHDDDEFAADDVHDD